MKKRQAKRQVKRQVKTGYKQVKIGGVSSKKQSEIIDLYSNQFLTAKQISCRLKITIQYVYRIIKKMKEKGIINKAGEKIGGGFNLSPHPLRLHAMQFVIKILWKDRRYFKIKKERGNIFDFKGDTIKLNEGSVEVYSSKSFFGVDPRQLFSEGVSFYNNFFRRLEEDLKVILIKPRSINIKLCQFHIAETQNEIAKDYEHRRGIRIHAQEDGKLWFLIDNSFNFHEMEFVHPKTALEDSEKVLKHVNDFRNNDPPTISEVMVILKDAVVITKETAAGLNGIVHLMQAAFSIKKEEEYGLGKVEKKKRPDYIG